MSLGAFVYKISAGVTTCAGVSAMDSKEFNPLYLFFHLTLIIVTATLIGFLAETRFKNYMKKRNDRLGRRYV